MTGNASALTVTDLVGGNTIAGGAGGLSVTACTADAITTASNAANQVSLFRYDTLSGAGADQVTASANANVITETAAATVNLLGAGNVVNGGAGLIQVGDSVGCDSITGGAGGVTASLTGTYDVVNTAAGATDTIKLSGKDVLNSAGNDQVTVNGAYNQVTVTGASSITTGAGWSIYDLEGYDTLTANGAASITVGQHATATVGLDWNRQREHCQARRRHARRVRNAAGRRFHAECQRCRSHRQRGGWSGCRPVRRLSRRCTLHCGEAARPR